MAEKTIWTSLAEELDGPAQAVLLPGGLALVYTQNWENLVQAALSRAWRGGSIGAVSAGKFFHGMGDALDV